MEGKLIIFSAPSGSGKTTIVQHLLKHIPELEFSISACSRDKRKDEKNGKDYYFIGIEEFKKKIKNNEFVEWEEVYENHFYGTLRSEIDRIWAKGKHVIFDLDVVGGLNLKKKFGDKALAVFVKAPSIEQLESRLRMRQTEDKESLKRRVDKALYEIEFAPKFDVIIVNDAIETAFVEAQQLVREFLK